jgi:spermidine/putrescine transport system ATP-binding protein
VAGFLGVSNLLDAEVTGQDGAMADLRLADGNVVRAPAGTLDGSVRVRIGVRPEKLRVQPLADGEVAEAQRDVNAIEGRVLDASYIGVSTQYIVETADGHRITVYAQNLETSGAGEVLAGGQRVRLAWKPQHTFVIGPAGEGVPAEEPDEEDSQTRA